MNENTWLFITSYFMMMMMVVVVVVVAINRIKKEH
jgi:hypothetical protein